MQRVLKLLVAGFVMLHVPISSVASEPPICIRITAAALKELSPAIEGKLVEIHPSLRGNVKISRGLVCGARIVAQYNTLDDFTGSVGTPYVSWDLSTSEVRVGGGS